MILTDKCKEDFIKTKIGNEINLFESMLPIYKNELLIDFFDSVGIYINIRRTNNEFMSYITNDESSFYKKIRQEALSEAIKKANEIYNKKIK